jgi:hypothetical protein
VDGAKQLSIETKVTLAKPGEKSTIREKSIIHSDYHTSRRLANTTRE